MTIIPIKGFIGWDVTPQDISEALAAAKGADVVFEIATGGGFIAPGLDIFNQIRNYQGHTTSKLTGYAMSMGSYIPLASDRVIAEDNAVYMIHNARGGVFGDHLDILKHGAYLKGLSGIIAKQYSKTTGSPVEEMQGLMDEETYFFGNEMVDAGFVDEIIESSDDNDDDQDSAVARARAAFEDVMVRMNADPAAVKADMAQAAAMIKDFNFVQLPAKAGKTQVEEVQQMALTELLSKNPVAAAEYEANLVAARAEGKTAGQDAMASTIKRVTPFLMSKEYPDVIGATAVKVLTGESEIVELTAAVAAVDAVREEARSVAEAAAAGQETPGQQNPAARKEGEPTSTEEDLQADIAAAKGEG